MNHELVSSVGRQHASFQYSVEIEQELLNQFKRESLPFLISRPTNDWEWLALAQHRGVPTRLLDWSESPYVSLFFAVWGKEDQDVALYIAKRPPPAAAAALGDKPFELNVYDVFFYYLAT